MSLFDFLKRKKGKKKAETTAKKPKNKPLEEKPQNYEAPVKQTAKKVVNFSYEAVREPHISEKTTYSAEENQYVFKVSPNYNKNEIKKSVEGVYGVDVLSVNITKIPLKKRRIGKIQGQKKGYIKAVVKIKQGQKIEIL
ncbi:MAG: 50S ribosomal protein L23 [Patescibacteria group bacterium]